MRIGSSKKNIDMANLSLISIIIPAYNRADLIAETLDSILAQTYKNWECIIVDDGSSDDTQQIVEEYASRDPRFKSFSRTYQYGPGGNGARNYGLDLAIGEYIVFFDSDDLMTEDHLQVKYDSIMQGDYDFSITRTKYFNYSNEHIDKYYNFSIDDITVENYLLQKINWLTLDVIVKAKIAKKVRFNEVIKSGQEYNYYAKLLGITEKVNFKDSVVSLRRFHEQSKRVMLASGNDRHKSAAISKWITFTEMKDCISQKVKKKLVFQVYKRIIYFNSIPNEIYKIDFFKEILKSYRWNGGIKILYVYINRVTNRFEYLRKIALRK
jgi:glycosyltransferase involved in cell wall biosynthesis